MRDTQKSKIYAELLKLLIGKAMGGILTIQVLDFLCEHETATVPDFVRVNQQYDRGNVYKAFKKLVKIGLFERVPEIPYPEDFMDWGKTRQRKWNGANRGAIKYRITPEIALNAINKKIAELEDLEVRLSNIRDKIF